MKNDVKRRFFVSKKDLDFYFLPKNIYYPNYFLAKKLQKRLILNTPQAICNY